MKTLIFFMVLLLCSEYSQAQTIELAEARINFQSVTQIDKNSFSVALREKYAGDFEKDPVKFVEKNFDIKQIISQVENKYKGYDSYLGIFRSRKGELICEFDNTGDILSSTLKFKNIFLPRGIRHQLYLEHQGWTMIRNVRAASMKRGIVKKDAYYITLKNGKQTKKLKIDAQKDIPTTVVTN